MGVFVCVVCRQHRWVWTSLSLARALTHHTDANLRARSHIGWFTQFQINEMKWKKKKRHTRTGPQIPPQRPTLLLTAFAHFFPTNTCKRNYREKKQQHETHSPSSLSHSSRPGYVSAATDDNDEDDDEPTDSVVWEHSSWIKHVPHCLNGSPYNWSVGETRCSYLASHTVCVVSCRVCCENCALSFRNQKYKRELINDQKKKKSQWIYIF